MTIEEKKQALHSAIDKAWGRTPFYGAKWHESKPNLFVLGEKTFKTGCLLLTAMMIDIECTINSGIIWFEYEPEKDLVGIYIKEGSIQQKFKEDFKALFEKYAPFNMKMTYERKTTPIISRVEKVEPKGFVQYLKEFKKAYRENYPLFYMFTVGRKDWYESFDVWYGEFDS